jgi:hypothetical protein
MSAHNPQIVDPQEFIDILDYEFLGDEVTVQNKRKVIENLRLKAAVYVAAQASGVSKKTVYQWAQRDPQFAEAMAEAREDAKEIMENSVYEDALNGNTLLKMFWLKRHDPNYRDKVQVDVSVVMEEIEQRVAQLGLRELPAELAEMLPIPSTCADLQKEPDEKS